MRSTPSPTGLNESPAADVIISDVNSKQHMLKVSIARSRSDRRRGGGGPDTVVAMLMTPVPRRACGAAADRPGARSVCTERHFENVFKM